MLYCINTETYEVHVTGCPFIPKRNKIFLGTYENPSAAVIAAKSKGYSNADGCYSCCSSAHTK